MVAIVADLIEQWDVETSACMAPTILSLRNVAGAAGLLKVFEGNLRFEKESEVFADGIREAVMTSM